MENKGVKSLTNLLSKTAGLVFFFFPRHLPGSGLRVII